MFLHGLDAKQLATLHVAKMDGKIEPFDQLKLINSIRNSTKDIVNLDIDEDNLTTTIRSIVNQVSLQKMNPVSTVSIFNQIIELLNDNKLNVLTSSMIGYRKYRDEHRRISHQMLDLIQTN